MYKSGCLQITTPPCDSYDAEVHGCQDDTHCHIVHDTETSEDLMNVAYLPEAIDEWVIGGSEQIRALIGDLQAALLQIDGKPLIRS